ncbi:MAG: hypothetical protein ACQEP4_03835 [Bacillota bacterium]
MKVSRISIRTEKKTTIRLQRAVLLKDRGIKGDKNARGGERQLSILPLHVREDMDSGQITGLCIPRFTENITYTGDQIFEEGEIYKLGEAIVKISSTRKKCFPECINIIKNKPCTLVKSVSYAKIIFGGHLSINDGIQTFRGLKGSL